MSVDLSCETDRCPAWGRHIVFPDRGRPRWLCDDCTAWVLAPPEARCRRPRRPAVDLALAWLLMAAYLAGLLVAVHGLARLVTQVEVDAGLAWLRWAQILVGGAVSIWCWGLAGERVTAWQRRADR